MTEQEKHAIKARLADYCQQKGSQNKAANSLKNISSTIVSRVLSEQWDLISDEMWRSLSAQLQVDSREWKVVETRGFRRMWDVLRDSQEQSLVMAVTGDAGCGKSEAVKMYARSNGNVYVLSCSEYWNRKMFLQELLAEMGRDLSGCTVGEMMAEVIRCLKRQERPLLVLDEADKLSDQVLYFFISIYNKLEDQCGMVLCATDYLEKRIHRGIRNNRKGYKEIYSRIGRKFIPLQVVNRDDVAMVCRANGINDEKDIREIAADCDCDLRRVKRMIYARK